MLGLDRVEYVTLLHPKTLLFTHQSALPWWTRPMETHISAVLSQGSVAAPWSKAVNKLQWPC